MLCELLSVTSGVGEVVQECVVLVAVDDEEDAELFVRVWLGDLTASSKGVVVLMVVWLLWVIFIFNQTDEC